MFVSSGSEIIIFFALLRLTKWIHVQVYILMGSMWCDVVFSIWN